MRSMGSVGLRSDPRQHPFAESAHCGDDRFFVGALEIEIDRANAEIAQRSDIVDELGVAAGEQPSLAIGGARRHRIAVALDPVGQRHRPSIAGFFSVHSVRKAATYSSVTAPLSANGVVTTASNSAFSQPRAVSQQLRFPGAAARCRRGSAARCRADERCCCRSDTRRRRAERRGAATVRFRRRPRSVDTGAAPASAPAIAGRNGRTCMPTGARSSYRYTRMPIIS